MSITTKIHVSGMTCSACTNSITSAVNRMTGINSVSVSLLTEEAVVHHSSEISSDTLVEAIDDAGFDAEIISSNSDMGFTDEKSPVSSSSTTGTTASTDSMKTIVQIGGMTCSSCSNSITNSLLKIDGVQSADVSLITEEATIVHSPSVKAEILTETIDDTGFEATLLSTTTVTSSSNMGRHKTELSVSGMTCASCVSSITNGLKKLSGVEDVNLSLMTEKATVVYYDPLTPDTIKAEIEDLGFEANILNTQQLEVTDTHSDKPNSEVISTTLKIFGMTCSSCANTIENALINLDGIVNCSVSLSLEEAHIEYNCDIIGIRTIINEIQDCGFDALLMNKLDSTSQIDLLSKVKEINHWRQNFFKLLIAGLPVFFLGHIFPMIMMKCHWDHDFLKIWRGIYADILVQFALGTYIQFWLGESFYINCYKSLRHGAGSMDVLICVSTTIVYFYSAFSIVHSVILNTYPNVLFDTSTMLFIFVSLGKWVESKAKGNTSTALSKLLSLTPSSCIIVENPELFEKEKGFTLDSASVSQKNISVDLLQKNDIVVILPGSKVPADGDCVFGSSETDESLLTGESTPVKKFIGSKLIGGSVNVSSILYMRVTALGEKTQLQQIVKLVKDAQVSNAPVQRFADSIASIFVPSILVLSLITLIFWSLYVLLSPIESIPKIFLNKEKGTIEYFKILQVAISVVVVACPCALGLAAPTAVMVGTGVGAKNGVLIKGGEILEKASSIDTVIFDKTGTLTNGVMELTHHQFYGDFKDKATLVWSLIRAIESNSEHPISKALVKGAEELILAELQTFEFDYVNTYAGLGISASCLDSESGKKLDINIGNARFMKTFDISNINDLEEAIEAASAFKKISSICHILINNTYVGYTELADTLKPEAKSVIDAFINSGYSIGMVTGDSVETSKYVAGLLGIPLNNVLAESNPEQKLDYVKSLQHMGLHVAFIGDGINDAPALVQSDTGIAISSGTDIAMSAADIVLLSSSKSESEKSHLGLMCTFAAFDISRSTFHTIKMNFLLAIIYNLIMLPVSMGLLIIPFNLTIHPMVASAAMACSSTSVILNSLTLKKWNMNTLQKKIQGSIEHKYGNLGWNDGLADTRSEINVFSTDSFIINSDFTLRRTPMLVRAYERVVSLFRRSPESYQHI